MAEFARGNQEAEKSKRQTPKKPKYEGDKGQNPVVLTVTLNLGHRLHSAFWAFSILVF